MTVTDITRKGEPLDPEQVARIQAATAGLAAVLDGLIDGDRDRKQYRSSSVISTTPERRRW